MKKLYVPHDYQKLIVGHQHEHARNGTFAGMGMGKTSSTLTALTELYDLGVETQPTLILAPLRVAQSTWPDEAKKWEHLRGIEVVPVVGTADQRALALRRDAPFFTTNYENLPWLIEWFKHNPRPWPFGTIVADESTKLKSTRVAERTSKTGKAYDQKSGGSVRGAALAEVSHTRVHRFVELTGTPAPNGLKDLWGQLWHLDKGRRLGKSFAAFQQRWFRAVPGAQGYNQIEPMPHAQAEIQAAIRDICLSLEAKNYFDLEDPIVRPVYVELPTRVRKLYRDMERDMFAQIDGDDIEAPNAAAKTMKCLQLANGAVYKSPDANPLDDMEPWHEVHDLKIQALAEIVEEAAGMPVLVAYHFKSDLARLQKAFPKGHRLDSNPETIRLWNAGKIPVLFAHPASAGHGLNLQDGGNILTFFGHWWNLEERQQIIERIGPTRQKQAGHERPVFIYEIVARDTVDEVVIARMKTKRGVQDLLMEALRRRAAGKELDLI